MLYAIAVIAAAVLIACAQYVRRKRGLSITYDTLSRDAIISFGVGGAVAFGVVPAVVTSVRFVVNDSKMTADVFRGFDGNTIMLSLSIGAFFTTLWTVKEYLNRLQPPRPPRILPQAGLPPPAIARSSQNPRRRKRPRRP